MAAHEDDAREGHLDGNHAGRDLRGGRFEGQILDGADFHGADIRGADFRGASLVGVSFRDTRLGVRPLVGWLLLIGAIVVCGAAGVATGFFAENVRRRLLDPDWDDVANGASMAALVVIFVVTLIVKGISKALLVTGAALALAVVVNTVANLVWDNVDWSGGSRAIGLVLAFGLAVLAGVLGRAVGGTLGAWAIAIVAALGGLSAGRAHGGIAGISVSVLLVLISRRALRGDPRDRPIRVLTYRIVSRWGTRFNGADLTGADFAGADARQCDTSGAVLDGVQWDDDAGPEFLDDPDGS